jgi:DNA-directed RNA polymerase subunit L
MSFSEIVRDAVTVKRGGADVTLPVKGRIEFRVSGADIAYVNGLRRSLMADVVTAAVAFDPADPDGQDLTVTENTGVLHNEFVGHRVSLVPLNLTREELSGLRDGEVTLSLDVSNREGDKPLSVTSRDISVEGGGLDRDRVFPPDPVTGRWPLLTVLMPRGSGGGRAQRLAFRAKVSLGTGSDHARHCPVAACSVFPVRDGEAAAAARERAADKATFDAVEAPHIWKGGEQPEAHAVCLESVCGIPPAELVEMGFEAMATRMRRLAEKLGDPASPDAPDEPPMRLSPDVSGVKLAGETETAGALIQAELLGEGGPCDFCGYFTPHPLQRCIVVRLRAKDPGGRPPRELVRDACLAASVKAQQLADDWREAAAAAAAAA